MQDRVVFEKEFVLMKDVAADGGVPMSSTAGYADFLLVVAATFVLIACEANADAVSPAESLILARA